MAGSSRRSPVVHWLPPTVAALLIHGAGLSLALSPRLGPSVAEAARIQATLMSADLAELELNALEPIEPNAEAHPTESSTPATRAIAAAKPRSAHTPRAVVPSRAAPHEPIEAAPVASEVSTQEATPASPAGLTPNLPSPPNSAHTGSSRAPLGVTDATSSAMAPATLLGTKPRLISAGTACQGVLGGALDTPTKVTLVLQVATDGTASPTAVRAASGHPAPGLTAAAQRCAQRLRFLPARSASGQLMVASSVVKLTFGNRLAPNLRGIVNSTRTTRRQGAI